LNNKKQGPVENFSSGSDGSGSGFHRDRDRDEEIKIKVRLYFFKRGLLIAFWSGYYSSRSIPAEEVARELILIMTSLGKFPGNEQSIPYFNK
jgi:hypothetical protein